MESKDTESSPTTKHAENNLLDLLGVNPPEQDQSYAIQSTTRFVLWKENRVVYSLFLRVFHHGQFQRAGLDGVIIGLNGSYLLQYLQLLYSAAEIPALLDDIYLIFDGWLTAYRQHPKKT